MFVYKTVTFLETSITSFGSFVFSTKLMKSDVSLTHDFCCWLKKIYLCNRIVFSVGLSVGGVFVSLKHTEEQLFLCWLNMHSAVVIFYIINIVKALICPSGGGELE